MTAEYVNREEVLEILSSRAAPWNGYQKVRNLLAADVEKVVHCEQCMFYEPHSNGIEGWCFGFATKIVSKYDFCSMGYSKEEDNG